MAVQGEDEVRQSGVPFAVVRPCALTEEPAGAELVISQGDTIKVFPMHLPTATSQLEKACRNESHDAAVSFIGRRMS